MFGINERARHDMMGLCFLVGAYADQKRQEARARALDPEGVPLLSIQAEPAEAREDKEEKQD